MKHVLLSSITLALSFSELARAEPAPPPGELTGAPGKGITFDAGPEFSLNLRLRTQLRWQLHVAPHADGERATDQIVNVNTTRIWLSGRVLAPELTYMIQLAIAGRDYRDGATSPIFDAYLDYKAHRDASVRVGQFFVPFDRLRTVREFALQLAERPRPVGEFTLDRDVGIIAYSDNFLADKSPVAYRVGVFGGGGTNLTTSHEVGGMVVGRVEVRPLGKIDDDSEGDLQRRAQPGLALGIAGAINRNTNRLRSTTGATFLGGTADYAHLAVDATFKWAGLAVQLEYLLKDARRDRIVSMDADGAERVEYTRSGRGYVAQASYTFDPPVELVGRFSRLFADAGTDPKLISERRAFGQEVAFGANYYFNGHAMKLQGSWIARMPIGTVFDNPDHLAIVQLDATF